MGKFLISLLIGVLIGGAATFYFFVGVPGATDKPGALILAPDTATPAGSAQIVLRQEFFNEVLATIFRDMNAPAFPLGANAISENPGDCDSRITVLKEGSGIQTAVRFENNRISAPLAFTGSYNSAVGCFKFTGWADTNLELRFDQEQKIVFGQINVQTVNLDGVNPIISGLVTPLVQTSLNNRVNPIPMISGKQISLDLPIVSTKGNLKADVKDVRAEFKDDALNLYVIYAFSGTASSLPTP